MLSWPTARHRYFRSPDLHEHLVQMPFFVPGPRPAAAQSVVDLMAALQESVQKAKASRGEDANVHDLPTTTTTVRAVGEGMRRLAGGYYTFLTGTSE